MPKVTVLMSVYNGARYLRESIESILSQTLTDYELLIINDGSTDDSRDIILSYQDQRIRLVDNSKNIGLTKSLNLGLELAKGELIARHDADDLSYPRRLERQVQFLDDNQDIVLLGASGRVIDETGKPKDFILRTPVGILAIRWYLMFENAFLHASVMFRRDVLLKKLGGYSESFVRYQDYDLWSRTARRFLIENLREVLIDCRSHFDSLTSDSPVTIAPLVDVSHCNQKVFLESPSIPKEWAYLFTRLRTRNMSPDKDDFPRNYDWNQVLRTYKKVWSLYCNANPDAEQNQTIRSHLAGSLYMISYLSTTLNRRISFWSYLDALKFSPKSDRYPSIFRYIALWVLGEKARHVYRRIGAN